MAYATNVPGPDEQHPQTFKDNVHPLAPNPLDPHPQWGIDPGEKSAPGGRQSAFSTGSYGDVSSESVGTSGGIKAQLFGRQNNAPDTVALWQGRLFSASTHREDSVQPPPANGTSALGELSTQYGPGLETGHA